MPNLSYPSSTIWITALLYNAKMNKSTILLILLMYSGLLCSAQTDSKEYYSSGELWAKGEKINDKRQGIWEIFLRNGELWALENYDEGLRSGKCIQYWDKEALKSSGIDFENGPHKEEGKDLYIMGIFTYKDDAKNGSASLYSHSGELTKTEFKNNSIHGPYKVFHPDGALKEEGLIHGVTRIGTYKTYYPSKQLKRIQSFEKGMQHGQDVMFHENGQIETTVQYVKGSREGRQVWFRADGSMASIRNYSEAKLHGDYIFYHFNGKIKSLTVYEKGEVISIKTYNEEGELIKN